MRTPEAERSQFSPTHLDSSPRAPPNTLSPAHLRTSPLNPWQRAITNFPYVGFGELTLQSDDINNVTIKGGNWTNVQPAVNKILSVCAATSLNSRPKKKLPLVFQSDARSISTKPYRHDFEYIDQVGPHAQSSSLHPFNWLHGTRETAIRLRDIAV